LFSRKRPAGLDTKTSAEALFQAFEDAKPDPQLYAATLQAIKDRLIRQHRFALSAEDERKIEYIFNVFFRGGPRMDYGFASTAPNPFVPSYHMLAVTNDGRGKNWVYLAREESYRYIREMQQKNLIVPLVGDFAGDKTIRTVSQYVKDRGATLSVFYISNVEDYIQPKWSAYLSNLAALPADNSTLLIRFEPYNFTTLAKIQDVTPRWPGTYYH
jgi:hypothetical protein